MDGETKKYGSKQVTGFSEYWKANNIYDLAGNCYEWTQEASNTSRRAVRGGGCSYDGSSFTASSRSIGDADFSYDSGRRFPSHFNNKVALDPVS